MRAGPVLQVEIGLPARLAAHFNQTGVPIPQPHTGFALLDTGASITGVDAGILTALGVNPVSTTTVLTPSGQQQQSLYPCQISFPGTPIPPLDFNAVTGSQLATQGLAALIGRDLLRHFLMIYNGVDGNWTLSF